MNGGQQEATYEVPLPNDIHAERVVLASILLDNEQFFQGAAELTGGDFYLGSHRMVFSCIASLLSGLTEGATVADYVTVRSELERRKQVGSVGGVGWLVELCDDHLNHTRDIAHHVAIIKEMARLRGLMSIFATASARAADRNEQSAEIVADTQNRLLEQAAEGATHAVRIGDVVSKVEQRIEEKRHISTGDDALGMTWGIPALDGFTRGAHDGEFTILGGESGGYKSVMANQMMLANARRDTPCALFAMDMTTEKVAQRFYPLMSEIITANMMRDPRLINLHTHVPEIQRVGEELQGLPIMIDETPSLDVLALIARIRTMRRKYGTRLFVIDYLQLIRNKSVKEGPERVADTVFKLRDVTKLEPTVHLLVLSQYAKADGFAKKGRRTRGDLYGGSAIHQAATNVMLLRVEKEEDDNKDSLLEVEFDFDKHRDGRKGKVSTYFDRSHLTFREPIPYA